MEASLVFLELRYTFLISLIVISKIRYKVLYNIFWNNTRNDIVKHIHSTKFLDSTIRGRALDKS